MSSWPAAPSGEPADLPTGPIAGRHGGRPSASGFGGPCSGGRSHSPGTVSWETVAPRRHEKAFKD